MRFNITALSERLIKDNKVKGNPESLRPQIQRFFGRRLGNNELKSKFYGSRNAIYWYRILREYGIGSARELLGPEFVELRDKLEIDEELAAILYITQRRYKAKTGVDILEPIKEKSKEEIEDIMEMKRV